MFTVAWSLLYIRSSKKNSVERKWIGELVFWRERVCFLHYFTNSAAEALSYCLNSNVTFIVLYFTDGHFPCLNTISSLSMYLTFFLAKRDIANRKRRSSGSQRKILEVALVTDEITSQRYPEYKDISTVMLILGNIVSKYSWFTWLKVLSLPPLSPIWNNENI